VVLLGRAHPAIGVAVTTYQVLVNGIEAWTASTADYDGILEFPPEYLGRPASGFIELLVDDVVVSVSRPEGEE
jgi:hypothetical protein